MIIKTHTEILNVYTTTIGGSTTISKVMNKMIDLETRYAMVPDNVNRTRVNTKQTNTEGS